MRVGGLRVVVYFNDHPPAHVHVLGPGWAVLVNLLEPSVREVINCGEREAREALRLVAEHGNELMEAWRRIHG
jgi:hypothetical protein